MPEGRFIELSGAAFNTIPPNDFGYWEIVNELVQQEPPGSGDPELLGLLAAVGIVHGKPFEPSQRMRKILEEAVVVGNATARTVAFAPRAEEDVAYYPARRGSTGSSPGATSSSTRPRNCRLTLPPDIPPRADSGR